MAAGEDADDDHAVKLGAAEEDAIELGENRVRARGVTLQLCGLHER